jgi:hypothetical protein
VRFSVFALDYDGTVARDDTIDRSARDAIAVLRTAVSSCCS